MRAPVEAEPARSLRLRQRDDAPAARGDDAVSSDVVDARGGDPGREGVRRFSSANGVTIGSPNASTNRPAIVRRRFHRHLLAENRAHPQLEAVEGTRHPQAGIRPDRRCQARVPAEMLRDQVGPRVEIEQCPDAAEQRRQHRRKAVRELDQSARAVFFDSVTLIQPFALPSCTVRAYEPSVTCSTPVERPSRQKREDALPVVGRTIRELQGRRLAARRSPRPRSLSCAAVSAASRSAG